MKYKLIIVWLILFMFLARYPARALPPAGPSANAVTSNVISGIPKVIMLQGSSFEGCPLTFAIGTGPSSGTLQQTSGVGFTAGGALLYTSNSGFTGQDAFTYTVQANTTSSCTATPVTTSPATVTLTVGNSKTQIAGSLAGLSGGKISFVLTGPSTTYDGAIASGTTVTATVASNGSYTVYLYPTYGMNPPQYWNARYTNGSYSANFGPYNVPVSGTTLTQANLEASRAANANQRPLTIANEIATEMLANQAASSVAGANAAATAAANSATAAANSASSAASAAATAHNYDLSVMWSGLTLANQKVLLFVANRAFTLALTGSTCFAETAATAQTDFLVTVNNGPTQATLRFAAAGTTCTVVSPTSASINSGDVIRIIGPATPDATLANITFTLKGNLP